MPVESQRPRGDCWREQAKPCVIPKR